MKLDYAGGFHAPDSEPALRQLACHYTGAVDVFLAPGASGTVETMKPWLDGLARRGFTAHGVSLPRGRAEAAVPAYRAAVAAAGVALRDAVIGGQSFGGRVASLLAADESPAGLILLSYPLHRPGDPGQLRTEHWSRISCPTLLLSGEADPFARISLLSAAVGDLTDAQLFTYPRVGHGLGRVIEDALDRLSDFLALVAARSA
jgi:predicted alpha/beta-hydrolase family hydrolase